MTATRPKRSLTVPSLTAGHGSIGGRRIRGLNAFGSCSDSANSNLTRGQGLDGMST